MTDFVLEQRKKREVHDLSANRFYHTICNYANFLKQPLTLGMFVPCDLEGNILTKPPLYNDYKNEEGGNKELFRFNLEQYKQAQERILFKGWELSITELVKDGVYIHLESLKILTIESLFYAKVELTESAIKQFL